MRRIRRISSVGALLAVLGSGLVPALAATATWQGGSGSYGNPANWLFNPPQVPAREPCDPTDDVVIPAGLYTVTVDAGCTISTLSLGDNVTLSVQNGAIYTVQDQADLFGIVNVAGSEFLASTAAFPGTRARVLASAGANVVIGAPSYSAAGLIGAANLFVSSGGSTLDLSSLSTLDDGFNDGTIGINRHFVSADGGTINLSGLLSASGPIRADDILVFDVSNGGTINLPSLSSVAGNDGRTRFDVHAASLLELPALVTAHDVQFFADGGGVLRVNGPQAASYDSTGIRFTSDLIKADGAGSLVDLTAIRTIDAGFNDGSSGVSWHAISSTNGGVIDLRGLESISGPIRADDRLDLDANGGAIELDALQTIGGAAGRTKFLVRAGSTVSLPALLTATDAQFFADTGGTLSVEGAQPVAYASRAWFSLTLMSCDGAESRLNLSAIRTIDAGFNDGSSGVSWHAISSTNGGVIDLRGLESISGPIRADDRLDLDANGGAIELDALQTIGGAAGRTKFLVRAGSTVSLPALLTATDAQFFADTGGTLSVEGAQPVAYASRAWFSLTLMSCDGAESRLNLSAIRTIDAGFNDGSSGVSWHAISSTNGGVIDLRGLESISGPIRADDRLDLDANGGAIELDALQTIGGAAGRTKFLVRAGSTVSLPALLTATDAQFFADTGGTLSVEGAQPVAYASRAWFSLTLMSCDGAESRLNLSAIRTIDAGFNDGTSGVSWHAISSTNGGVIDLRGLESISGPIRAEDRIELDAAGGSIQLNSLTTIGGAAGLTRFDVHAGSALSLPALQTTTNAQLFVDGGGTLAVNGTQPVSYNSRTALSVDLMRADGAGSLLDLRAIRSIDDAFDDFTSGLTNNTVRSENGGEIDLSELTTVTTPLRAEDRLVFSATASGLLKLDSLGSLGGTGRASFDADAGELVLGSASLGAATDFDVQMAGSLRAGDLLDDPDDTSLSVIDLLTADVTCDIDGTLDLGSDIALNIVEPRTEVRIGRDLSFGGVDESAVQLEAARVVFDGVAPQSIEIGSENLGAARPASANFGIGRLVVGQPGQPTLLQLQDSIDNGNRTGGAEAVYLLGLDPATPGGSAGLQVAAGSTLSLACLDAYVFDDDIAPTPTLLNDLFAVPGTTKVPFGNGFVQLDGDLDGDGFPDCADNCPRTANPAQTDSDMDGIGDLCDVVLQLTNATVAEAIEGLGVDSQGGTAVAAAGDLNGDGVSDFLVGSPGYQPPGGPIEAGAVAVYLGSAIEADRTAYDILFVGAAAHDRAGVSVAGDFDFNDDGLPDILIGAVQTDTTGGGEVPVGAGKAYLIFFDPSDTTSYPNIGTPGLVDEIDLSRVGNEQPDEIPGVVFEGTALGDRAGFAVAAGRSVDAGIVDDIILGAPGVSGDAGAAYAIFGDAALTGNIALDRVANNGMGEVGGFVVQGDVAGDELGFAVAFPGDVIGTAAADLAIGAPGADLLALDAGVAFVIEGGQLPRDIVEGCSVGDDEAPQPTAGAQVRGTQVGERMASSLAGGGDNLVNGDDDLLIGAPLYDRGPDPGDEDAGRVAQTASRIPAGFIAADDIGAPANDPGAIPGAIWVGDAGGDQLGAAVAGLGDITGDGLDDIALGAPFADPGGVIDAGTIYVVSGYVPITLSLGVIDLALGFPGTQLVGTQEGELAGSALAPAGDVDDDGDEDYLIGAPGHDEVVVGDDTGRVYVVLECGTADSDADGVLDCEDNCPGDANAAQLDTDGDGLGDLCDLCPLDSDPGQPDVEADGIPDACDNCPDLPNPSQIDADADGVGEACDTNPVFTVSSDPADNPDFDSIQQAVNTATESGTTIEILPGTGCYVGTILVDRFEVLKFIGVGPGVCVDGGGGFAFDVRSTFEQTPIVFRNLTLMGLAGIVAGAPTRGREISFRDIVDVAIDLNAGAHDFALVDADGSVARGVDLAFGAVLTLERSSFEDLTGVAMQIDGDATVGNTVVAQAADGLVLGSGGELTLRHSTIALSGDVGVDNSAAGAVAISHSIVWGSATSDLAGVACGNVAWSLTCTPDCTGTNDNLCGDPLFVDNDADYHLQAGSPAIEHGPDPALFAGEICFDRDGGPRARDHDGDGLARFDTGAYERENTGLTPAGVVNLRWDDLRTLLWDVEPSATNYHVYRDSLAGLGYDAFGACRDDLDPDRTDTLLIDPAQPVSGEIWIYLITADDGATEGTLGLATCTERSNLAACP